jgi:copper homeostasis protein
MILEACVQGIEEVKFASKKGFKRIELCSSLQEGGLTPSQGLIKHASKIKGIETHVMIRPRAGDFCYNLGEIAIVKSDIKTSYKMGASGVVFGLLNQDNKLALENIPLIQYAQSKGLEVTFHRAFDLIEDKDEAVRQLISWNVKRILTSGGGQNVMEGIDVLQNLSKTYGDQIEIMAASGVDADNIHFLEAAGIKSIHFSISQVNKATNSFGFGSQREIDRQKVTRILEAI